MLILGIDPGTATTGYALLSVDEKNKIKLLKLGWIETVKDLEHSYRLRLIYKNVLSLMKGFSPEVVAMERLFFFSNQKTAIRVGQAQGVLILAAAECGIPILEYPPGQVKLSVGGNGRADKKHMQKTICELFKIEIPAKKKSHFDNAADAVAIALTHAKVVSAVESVTVESSGAECVIMSV